MEERKLFCEIDNIESLTCVLGLNFPDSATEFQKAFLTLAHLCASCRDYVLKGSDIPIGLIRTIDLLSQLLVQNELQQR